MHIVEVEFLAMFGCIFVNLITLATASSGDRSWTFNKCLKECHIANCSSQEITSQLPLYMVALGWNCDGECKYICMWKTVDGFQKDGSTVPQFYGKWPFIRLFGIQEPASALFSLLNGVMHLAMICYFRRKILPSAPLYYIWHVYALIAVNAWFWSVVFHTRDTNFTEKMDYFCAILLVLYSLFALCARLQEELAARFLSYIVAIALSSFYVYHVHYLAFVRFDYGYNLKANIIVGLSNAVGWLVWAKIVWKRQPYVWKAVISIVSIMILLLLELGDFPPVLWILDAHALWHAGTVPVTFIWYSFVVDDCRFMLERNRHRWNEMHRDNTAKEKEV